MGDTPFITAHEVGEFATKFALSRRGFQSDQDIFNDFLSELSKLNQNYTVAEQEAYGYFKVKNLVELQKKIDAINSSNLLFFQNEYLNKVPQKNTTFASITDDQILQGFTDLIYNSSGSNVNVAIDQVIQSQSDKIVEGVLKAFREGRKTINGDAEGSKISELVARGKIKDMLQKVASGNTSKLFDSKTYKKDFVAYLKNTNSSLSHSTWDIRLEVPDITSDVSSSSLLSYYPYFDLTPEQEVEAKQSQPTWENFCNHIADTVGTVNGNLTPELVRQIMNSFGIAAFIKKDFAGVVGILGELQASFIVGALTGDAAIAAGPQRNQAKNATHGGELGVDLLLNSFVGIQVKNYKAGPKGNYWLKKTFSWSGIEDMLNANPMLSTIGDYYSAICFNKPIRGASDQYENLYAAMNSKSGAMYLQTQAFWASNVASFMNWQDIYKITYGDVDPTVLQGVYMNAFYLFGGKTLIPTSYIIRLIINRLYKLREQLNNKEDVSSLKVFYMTYSYDGPTWESEEQARGFSQKQILDAISFHYLLNLYVPDLNLSSGGPAI